MERILQPVFVHQGVDFHGNPVYSIISQPTRCFYYTEFVFVFPAWQKRMTVSQAMCDFPSWYGRHSPGYWMRLGLAPVSTLVHVKGDSVMSHLIRAYYLSPVGLEALVQTSWIESYIDLGLARLSALRFAFSIVLCIARTTWWALVWCLGAVWLEVHLQHNSEIKSRKF